MVFVLAMAGITAVELLSGRSVASMVDDDDSDSTWPSIFGGTPKTPEPAEPSPGSTDEPAPEAPPEDAPDAPDAPVEPDQEPQPTVPLDPDPGVVPEPQEAP